MSPRGIRNQDNPDAQETQGDMGQAEVQEKRDEMAEKGHWGEKPPGPDNEAYSLKSGPDSPSALEAATLSAERRLKAMRGSDA